MAGGLAFILGLLGLGAIAADNSKQKRKAQDARLAVIQKNMDYSHTNWELFYEILSEDYFRAKEDFDSAMDISFEYLKNDNDFIKACNNKNIIAENEQKAFMINEYHHPIYFDDKMSRNGFYYVNWDWDKRKWWENLYEKLGIKKTKFRHGSERYVHGGTPQQIETLLFDATQFALRKMGYWAGDDYLNVHPGWYYGVNFKAIPYYTEKERMAARRQDQYIQSNIGAAYRERNKTYRYD